MRSLGLDPAATLPGPAREITVEPIELPRREPVRAPRARARARARSRAREGAGEGAGVTASAPDLIEAVVGFRKWTLKRNRLSSPFIPMRWEHAEVQAECFPANRTLLFGKGWIDGPHQAPHPTASAGSTPTTARRSAARCRTWTASPGSSPSGARSRCTATVCALSGPGSARWPTSRISGRDHELRVREIADELGSGRGRAVRARAGGGRLWQATAGRDDPLTREPPPGRADLSDFAVAGYVQVEQRGTWRSCASTGRRRTRSMPELMEEVRDRRRGAGGRAARRGGAHRAGEVLLGRGRPQDRAHARRRRRERDGRRRRTAWPQLVRRSRGPWSAR